jgi:hypothetical protein
MPTSAALGHKQHFYDPDYQAACAVLVTACCRDGSTDAHYSDSVGTGVAERLNSKHVVVA